MTSSKAERQSAFLFILAHHDPIHCETIFWYYIFHIATTTKLLCHSLNVTFTHHHPPFRNPKSETAFYFRVYSRRKLSHVLKSQLIITNYARHTVSLSIFLKSAPKPPTHKRPQNHILYPECSTFAKPFRNT